ncbi:MAG: hypothetical protein R3301_18890, partial [Saprospiraceae bacterium]|nr:hypothetical protein [Saprospiraceae bacterium]
FAEKYGRFGSSFLPRLSRRPVRLTDAQRFLQYLHQRNRLQSPTHSSGDLTPVNYVLNAYEKTAFAFRLLEGYLGRDSFDHAMQTYFHTWQFRHPGPEDLRGVLESACICDLSWLFDGLLGTALLPDYAIADITNDSLYLVNLGQLTPPVQVLALRGDTVVREFWIDGFHGRRAIATDLVHADRWQLYADEVSLDGRPDDNQILANGRRGKQTRLSWIGDVADPGSNHLNISVIPGWNKTDGGMLGLAVSNLHWPPRNLLWMAAPYYATGSESLTGLGEIRYRLPGGSYRKHWELGLAGKSFHYDRDTAYGFRDRYLKLAGSLQLTLKPADRFDTRTRYIRYRGVLVQQSYGRGIDFAQRLWSRERRHYWVNELRFLSEHPDPLAPNTLEIRFTQGKGFVRLTADIDQSFIYARGNKGIHLHGFAGWLPHRDAPLANVNFYFNGTSSNGFFSKDYLYDEILLARNARSGIWSQQVFAKDARLKTLYTGGVSDRWMVGAGLAVDLPWPIPVRPYLDFAVSPDLFDGKAQLNYSGGLALVLIPEVLEVYAPIIESREIRESLTYQTRKSLVQRMSFVINFKALHPFDLFTKF